MLTLIARLKPARLDWVGTSMGGLIGMGMAAGLTTSALMRLDRGELGLDPSHGIPLGRMVLNDIGPALNDKGLSRIAEYVGKREEFDRSEEHTSELQSRENLVCRLLLEKKKKKT